MSPSPLEIAFLRQAARLACRGHGGAEPNPIVGCVIVDPSGRVVGEGYHRRCGDVHAEAMALARAGHRAKGATAYVTLEPCGHHGRTPPCADALIQAGILRVVYGCTEPNSIASGGAARLDSAGVATELVACREVDLLNEPFLKRVRTGLPWVTAKWAQSIDGKVATRTGSSQWISNERSRRMVHRERGRVDAILTGYGTVRSDNPQLTARGVRVRRVATRVVVDPQLALDPTLNVFSTSITPTIVATVPQHADAAAERGVQHLSLGPTGQLRPLLVALARDHGFATILVEAGGGLIGELLRENLLDEAWIFIAPILMGDEDAFDAVRGMTPLSVSDAARWRMIAVRRRDSDALLHVRRQ